MESQLVLNESKLSIKLWNLCNKTQCQYWTKCPMWMSGWMDVNKKSVSFLPSWMCVNVQRHNKPWTKPVFNTTVLLYTNIPASVNGQGPWHHSTVIHKLTRISERPGALTPQYCYTQTYPRQWTTRGPDTTVLLYTNLPASVNGQGPWTKAHQAAMLVMSTPWMPVTILQCHS